MKRFKKGTLVKWAKMSQPGHQTPSWLISKPILSGDLGMVLGRKEMSRLGCRGKSVEIYWFRLQEKRTIVYTDIQIVKTKKG